MDSDNVISIITEVYDESFIEIRVFTSKINYLNNINQIFSLSNETSFSKACKHLRLFCFIQIHLFYD